MSYEHIFDELDIDADPFALCELQGRSRLGLGRQPFAMLHYVLAGDGEIIVGDHPAIHVKRGTLVLVPAIQPHTLSSLGGQGNPMPDCHPAELDLARHLRLESGDTSGGGLLAICSQVKVGVRGLSGLIDLIRDPLIERIGPESAMVGAVDQLLHELSRPKLGSRAMIRALLLQCMIQLLRSRLTSNEPGLRWMAALADENLWSALRLMLDQPGYAHSVESLAEAAGMSRSTFAQRFSEAYGSGPMELLRNLRMHLAASLLTESNLPVKRVAELAGFKSRSAFSRAFEGIVGKSPQSFRSDARNTNQGS